MPKIPCGEASPVGVPTALSSLKPQTRCDWAPPPSGEGSEAHNKRFAPNLVESRLRHNRSAESTAVKTTTNGGYAARYKTPAGTLCCHGQRKEHRSNSQKFRLFLTFGIGLISPNIPIAMALQRSVLDDLKSATDRVEVINNLWQDKNSIALEKSIEWNAFLAYYKDECRLALLDRGDHATIRQHQDIADIAKRLEDGRTKDQLGQEIVASALQKTQTREEKELCVMAEGSIRLAVRLVAMVDIGLICPGGIQGYTSLQWTNVQLDLKTVLSNHFEEKTSTAGFSRFGRLFNAQNLQRYANLKIRWTNSLNNHLRLVDEDSTLCVFHHVAFLKGRDR